MSKNFSGKMIVIILFMATFLVTFGGMSFHDIPPGYAVLVYDKYSNQLKPQIYTKGMLFIIPFKEETFRYKLKPQKIVFSEVLIFPDRVDDGISINTSDKKPLFLELELNFQLQAEFVLEIHQKMGFHYLEDKLIPIIRQTVKKRATLHTSQFIRTSQHQFAELLKSDLQASCEPWYTSIHEVKILRIQ